MTDKNMTDNTQLLEKLNNEIDSKLQFVDYAELKVNKHLAKNEQPETQHFAINIALLALEEEQNSATYSALLKLLVVQLTAYLALPTATVADAFRAEIEETIKQLNELVAEVETAAL
jgi:hypothetical protein